MGVTSPDTSIFEGPAQHAQFGDASFSARPDKIEW